METPKSKRRWMPVLLGLSLALNLAVVAAVGGAMWRASERKGPNPRAASGQAALVFALDRKDRREIRRRMRGTPTAHAEHMAQMLMALGQVPFDKQAVRQQLQLQRTDRLREQDAASAAWLERVSRMSDAERLQYVSRVREIMARHHRHKQQKTD